MIISDSDSPSRSKSKRFQLGIQVSLPQVFKSLKANYGRFDTVDYNLRSDAFELYN